MSRAPPVLVLLLACGATFAQGLGDPTQPPAQLDPHRAAGEAPQGPVLQSVILSQGRNLAVISGRAYRAGDRVGEAMLVSIAPDGVTLREAGKLRVLKLLPDVSDKSKQDGTAQRQGAGAPARGTVKGSGDKR